MRVPVITVVSIMLSFVTCSVRVAIAQCPDPANLVANCGFEVDDSNWSAVKADSFGRSLAMARSGVASLWGDAQELWTVPAEWRLTLETCVDVVPSVAYGSGAYLRLLSGSAVDCHIYINAYTDNSCTSFSFGHGSDWISPGTEQWSLLTYGFTSGVSTESVLLDIECTSLFSDFEMYLDDAFLGIGLPAEIFVDGFENGGTSRWSSQVGAL